MHHVPDLNVMFGLFKQVNPPSSLIDQVAGLFFKTRLLISTIQEHCCEGGPCNMHVVNVVVTKHFRGVKCVDFPSVTQIGNPRRPGK